MSNIVWLYGMSGAGKTTLGKRIAIELDYEFMDSDLVRYSQWVKPDFTPEGRRQYQEMLRQAVLSMVDVGTNVVVSSITPYADMREQNRLVFANHNYYEILVKANLDTLYERDPKGLYSKSARGEIENLTGVSDPFDVGCPDFCIDTSVDDVETSLSLLLSYLGGHDDRRL